GAAKSAACQRAGAAAPGQPKQPRRQPHVRGLPAGGQTAAGDRGARRVGHRRFPAARVLRAVPPLRRGRIRAGRDLDVDQLLVLHHLLGHPEIDTATASRLCQRGEALARETLNAMETERGYLERGGAGGRGSYWTL